MLPSCVLRASSARRVGELAMRHCRCWLSWSAREFCGVGRNKAERPRSAKTPIGKCAAHWDAEKGMKNRRQHVTSLSNYSTLTSNARAESRGRTSRVSRRQISFGRTPLSCARSPWQFRRSFGDDMILPRFHEDRMNKRQQQRRLDSRSVVARRVGTAPTRHSWAERRP